MPNYPYDAYMIRRIVSGGQTGADRAGLDAAIQLGLEHGGWVPKGRLAEDGEVPALYDLRETRTRSYLERTRANVRDSDGTVIFFRGALAGGSKRTQQFAIEAGKPCFLARLNDGADSAALVAAFRAWLREHRVAVLNVAGNRASKNPGIHDAVRGFLLRALSPELYQLEEERVAVDAPAAEELPLAAEAPAEDIAKPVRSGHSDAPE